MKHYQLIVASSLLCAIAPRAAMADDAAVLARKFGALEDVHQVSLSPDGQRLAYVAKGDNASVVYVVEIRPGAVPTGLLSIQSGDGKIHSCRWITSQRVTCYVTAAQRDVSGPLLTYTRAFAINADRSGMTKLSANTRSTMQYAMQFGGGVIDFNGGAPGTVLMTREHVPTAQIGSNAGNDRQGLGVDLVDTVTLKRTVVEPPRPSAVTYISDGHGAVRIVGYRPNDDGYTGSKLLYSFRPPASRDWQPLSKVLISDTGMSSGFYPVAVDAAHNLAYGFDQKDGFDALFSMPLDGSGTRNLVLAQPDVDIDGLVKVGPHGRVVGASYVTDKRKFAYFDPELRKLSEALGRAVPGQPLIHILDANEQESKLLLLGTGDTDPGTIYLYDKASHQLNPLLAVRSALGGTPLAPVRPITYKAADGTDIPGYLTLPVGGSGRGLPAIVMPHGGPAARDEWGFDWLVQFFAARGYAVLQPNYRGSTGYGADWYRRNGFQSWRTAVGDINDAGRWLLAQGIAAPGQLAAFGWSYGGYAALQGAALDPDLYAASVAVAPVTDLASLKQEASYFTSARLVERFIGTGPHVREGSPAQNVERIKVPVLLFHGDMDQNVDVAESRLMERKLRGAGKPVTYVEFAGLDHYLESAAARARMLQESDAFLRKAMKLAP